MAVPTTTISDRYDANGSTQAFPITFVYLDSGNIAVQLYDGALGTFETLVEDTDYTVSNDTVTTVATYAAKYDIIIQLDPDLTQLTDWVNNDKFTADSWENAVDKLTLITKMLQDQIDRCVRGPDGDASLDWKLADGAVDRAGNYLHFNAVTGAIETVGILDPNVTVTTFSQTILDDETAAEVRATLELATLWNLLLGVDDLATGTLDDLLLATCGPFEIKPWNKSLWARVGTSISTGTANTNTTNKLVLSTATFSADGVVAGDVVHNSTDNVYATVLIVESETSLLLNWDAFPDGNEAFVVYDEPTLPEQFVELTGALLDGDGTVAADTNTVNHLIDADGTDWTTNVSVGDWAMNLSTGKIAKVTAVAAHDLTLQWDAFPGGNETYYIYAGTVTISDADSLLNGYVVPEMNISGRFLGGGLSAGLAEDDQGQGHKHEYEEASTAAAVGGGGLTKPNSIATAETGDPVDDGGNGTPRTGEHTQPRTLRQTMIMRIK